MLESSEVGEDKSSHSLTSYISLDVADKQHQPYSYGRGFFLSPPVELSILQGQFGIPPHGVYRLSCLKRNTLTSLALRRHWMLTVSISLAPVVEGQGGVFVTRRISKMRLLPAASGFTKGRSFW